MISISLVQNPAAVISMMPEETGRNFSRRKGFEDIFNASFYLMPNRIPEMPEEFWNLGGDGLEKRIPELKLDEVAYFDDESRHYIDVAS